MAAISFIVPMNDGHGRKLMKYLSGRQANENKNAPRDMIEKRFRAIAWLNSEYSEIIIAMLLHMDTVAAVSPVGAVSGSLENFAQDVRQQLESMNEEFQKQAGQ